VSDAPRALVERPLFDALLVGGLSLFLLPFAWAAPREDLAVESDIRIALIVMVNYPHFIASYGRAYGRPLSFVTRHWPQLLLAPAVLVGALSAAWFFWDTPVAALPGVGVVDSVLAALGSATRWSAYGTVGPALFWALVEVMLFTVGWHYAKQTFGVTLVLSRYWGFPVDASVRSLLRAHLLALWGLQWTSTAVLDGVGSHLGFGVRSLGLPLPLKWAAMTAVAVTGLLLVRALVRAGRRPPPIILVPMAALYLWFGLADFLSTIELVATFHSMQYLVFIWRMERAVRSPAQLGLGAVALVATGWLVFQGLPAVLDRALHSEDVTGGTFFLLAVSLFVNIHHYFIDNVIWRFDDDQVRSRLLSPTSSPSVP